MNDDEATGADVENGLAFEQLASCMAPDKEAWKEDGNRFTPKELQHMLVSWSSARFVEKTDPDHRVD